MGERKGTNKYYPPDYDPKKGGLNAYHGTHALRERARKLHEGILIIRFEMPYNIWCGGCGKHIGMGVRFNAQKRKMGYYYTTPIYKFKMKCPLCPQWFEIQTDPKNCEYQILSGARRKEERWDTEKAENVQTLDREVKEKLMTNAMFKLEHGASDQQKARKVAPTLTRLEEIRDTWKDDFAVNQALRYKFRGEKKDIQLKDVADSQIRTRANLPEDLMLVNESVDDVKKAKRIRYGEDSATPDILRKQRKRHIKQSSIFGTSNDNKAELARRLANNNKTTTTNILKDGSVEATKKKNLKSEIFGIKVKLKKKSEEVESSTTESKKNNTDVSVNSSHSSASRTKIDSSRQGSVNENTRTSPLTTSPLHNSIPSKPSTITSENQVKSLIHDDAFSKKTTDLTIIKPTHIDSVMRNCKTTSDTSTTDCSSSVTLSDEKQTRRSSLLVDYNSSSSSCSSEEGDVES